jgi:hypothetical protein
VEVLPSFNLTGHAYAGFWRRLAAYLIDGLVLGVVQALVALIVFAIAPDDLRAQANFAPVVILVGCVDWSRKCKHRELTAVDRMRGSASPQRFTVD